MNTLRPLYVFGNEAFSPQFAGCPRSVANAIPTFQGAIGRLINDCDESYKKASEETNIPTLRVGFE